MPKSKVHERSGRYELDHNEFNHLLETMLQLAFRGPKEEELIMRVANAGSMQPVIDEIKRRRLYVKKMAGRIRGRQSRAADVRPVPDRRRRADRKLPSRKRTSPGPHVVSNTGEKETA